MIPIQIELPTLYAYEKVNSFLFVEDVPTIVDCGENSDECWEALVDGLEANGLRPTDIKRVIITHAHIDHMGMAGRLAKECKAEIYVSEKVHDWAVDLDKLMALRIQLFENILSKTNLPLPFLSGFLENFKAFSNHWQTVPKEKVKTFSSNGNLSIGGKEWKVIYAPGHSITQTCFFEPETQIFLSADAILQQTPLAVIEQDMAEPSTRLESLPQMIKTLESLSKMTFSTIYPGHGTPFSNHQDLITNQIRRINNRSDECLAYIKDGFATVFEIAQNMYPISNPSQFFIGFIMTIGYLDILIEQKKIERSEKNNLWYFKSV